MCTVVRGAVSTTPLGPSRRADDYYFVLLQGNIDADTARENLTAGIDRVGVGDTNAVAYNDFSKGRDEPDEGGVDVYVDPIVPSGGFAEFFLFSVSILPDVVPAV